jgi:hypothetical protein
MLLEGDVDDGRGEPFWAVDDPMPEPVTAPAWEAPADGVASVYGDMDDLGFDAALAGLGDLQPFTLEEAFPGGGGPESREIDFSDINDAPFDPGTLPQVAPAAAGPFQPAPDIDWDAAGTHEEVAALGEVVDDVAWNDGALGEAEPDLPEQPAAVLPRRDAGGLGLPPGSVAWPAFVNHTSELIDRSLGGGNLFSRLREAKQVATSAGLLQVDRSVRDLRPQASATPNDEERVQLFSVPAASAKPVPAPANGVARAGMMSETERIDVMAMRVRLIEDASSAGDVAQRLEGAVQRGLHDPLALRVLGEAYLKLGRIEQAAAQFRQAMLTRHRSR